MRLAAIRCDDRPNSILMVAGLWTCSLARGHQGDHAFHAGHDLDAAPVFTWARIVAPNAAVVAAPASSAQRIAEYDEYDLIPDATMHELRTLPTLAEMRRRDGPRF
jgi:hypothetical protein